MMASPKLHYDREAMADEPYFDLGTYSRPVTTRSEDAQTWFNRGLVWSYAFNHEESVRCFERSNREDPNCCMALFGLAYALGPNYNKPWEFFIDEERQANLDRARLALHAAKENSTNLFVESAPVEKALVDALQFRYSRDVAGTASEAYAQWNQDYAAAMEDVYHNFGDDHDVAALYADSLMNLTPWALWDIRTGEPAPGSRCLEIKAVLDRAIAQPGGREHPGLLHLYIHFMEMSASPESAIPVADHLRGLVPDAGHLHHMPSHLDVLCGDWNRSIRSNTDAVRADEKYVVRIGALNFYSLYRAHNYHFLIYSAMFIARYRVALDAVIELERSLPEDLLRTETPPMADWLESFLSLRTHVLVRFGKWDELKSCSLPKDSKLYCVTTAMVHYGKGIAYAASNEVERAAEQMKLFVQATTKVPESRTLFNNTAIDILAIARVMLEGEVEYRRGNFDSAFELLRKAIELSDSLPYDEPWGWMQPPRHAYGALLLEQGHIAEAAAVYQADLGLDNGLPRALQHPRNVWALHGLCECYRRLQDTSQQAIDVKQELERCEAEADVRISSSCFCRLTVEGYDEADKLKI